MKKLFVMFVAMFMVACSYVEPNNVGVLMQNYGKSGKSDFTLVKGKVSTMVPGTELFQVPLWEQRAGFEQPFRLKASDNTEFTSHPVYSFKVIEDRAVDVVFDNKHIGSGNGFMGSLQDNILEPRIYDLMKEESRKYTTDDLMAPGGSLKYEEAVQKIIAEEFKKKGLELIAFSAQLDFSDKVKAKIDNRNEVNTNISVLDQQIAEQKKRNELEELKAQQNIIASRGITPQLLQRDMIEKWDGHLPIGGQTPMSLLVNAQQGK